ncbi:MAG: nucleotidyltransferase domain-containing protein [Pseudomonadota bacterium]
MALTPDIPEDMRALIDDRLTAIEQNERAHILFAVESGSRAWGFPSPDSDFDVRFVYVRDKDWYLSIDQRRDVIELPIEGDLDINGWDLKKALQLLVKPNPVLLEWLRSPVVYRADRNAMKKITALGEKTAHQRPSSYHYLHLAESQYRRFIADEKEVKLKKYFYSLRPALALMWLRNHAEKPVPMNLAELRAGVMLPNKVSDFLDELLKKKAKTKELGAGPRHAALDALIEQEIDAAKSAIGELPVPRAELIEEANTLFRDLVHDDLVLGD